MAPLLPKLRGHFAEFLDNTSSAGLRILSSSTCVGLRYGYGTNDSGFSRRMSFTPANFLTISSVVSWLPFPPVFYPRPWLPLSPRIPSVVSLPPCVPAVLSSRSTGISTCRPSTTALALALGPDLPGADQLDSGNLGYSACKILTYISLLIPAFSLPVPPRALSVTLL